MICNHIFFDILTWDEPWMTWYAISNSGRGFFSPSESVRAMSPPMKHHAVATETGNKCHWETSLMIKMAPHLTILPCYKFITPMNTIVICDCCLRSINFFLLKLWSYLSRDFGPSEVVCVPHWVAASAELWLGRNLWLAESIPTRERRTPLGGSGTGIGLLSTPGWWLVRGWTSTQLISWGL